MKNKKTIPPPLATRLLSAFLRSDLAEEVRGDLEEKFYSDLKNKSAFKAKRNYWYEVFNYLRPFAIRKSRLNYLNNYDMFQSYFKIGWRTMSRQKMYSGIKIGGFAAAIAACLLIALFVRQELSYDLHYTNESRIYRILFTSSYKGELSKGVYLPAPFTKVMNEEYPDVEKAGRYLPIGNGGNFGSENNEVKSLDQMESTHENGFIYFDQGLLEILELPFIKGSPKNALTEPNTMVITKSKADKYFLDQDPIGKILMLDNDEHRQYKITGVIQDFPVTSHVKYNFLLTLAGMEFWNGEQTTWRASNYLNYVLVRPGTDISGLEKKLKGIAKKYFVPEAVKSEGNADELNWLNSMSFKLQPVHDIYLNKEEVHDNLQHGDLRYIWLFGAIASFILLIACINFINLSTARSAGRAREVGLRKVVGSLRSGLVKQFLSESVLFSLCSFVIGTILALSLLPYFNLLLAKSLTFPWNEWWFLPLFGAAAIVVGIIAGIYPAFYLSSFQPALVLKGNTRIGNKNSTTRSMLVVFQFSISIILIISTVVINRQMNYIMTKKLGYNKEQVLVLEGTRTLDDKILTFKNELLRLPAVQSASISNYLPVEDAERNGGGLWIEGTPIDDQINSQQWSIDHDYVKTLGLTISKGRDFSFRLASDSQAMIINESAVKALQLKEPIGSRLQNYLGVWTVIGVVKDFNSESMRENIKPVAMYIRPSPNTISVKLNTVDMQEAIRRVTKVWDEFSPSQPIRFTFLDQRYAKMYGDIERMQYIFTSFAVLAVMVACLGLFALSAFMVEQRSKEISVRIILGATLNNIVQLLTQNFIFLVLISFAIATPIAWYTMNRWLEDYAFKISLSWDIFLLAGIMSVFIALVTVGYQAIKAAVANPVNSLKSE